MAGKFKRAAKSCLLNFYTAGSGSLKEEKSFKLIIYLSGPGSFKESQRVVYCLFIWQGQET